MIDINPLIELDRLAREDGAKYARRRFLYEEITSDHGRHFTGIVGPRGVGKTILLKQIAVSLNDTFYLSLDTLEEDTFETVKALYERLKVKLFLLDEVHTHSGFEGELKKIYDFLNIRVIFTSSMALSLYQTAYDLSRRVVLKTLYPFSLREYVLFKHERKVKAITIDDIIEGSFDRPTLENGVFFAEYISGGLMPFALNEAYPLTLLKNILETVIYKDIARVSKLGIEDLDTIKKLLSFIGRSGIDGINYSSLSRNLGITKYKAEQYTAFLEQAFILQRVTPEGTGVLKEPKIIMNLPYRLLYRSFEEAVGGLREDFFVEAVKASGRNIHYLKSTRGAKTPDYTIGVGQRGQKRMVFEIGGKGKGRQQFKGFTAEHKIILSDGYETKGLRRPLFLFGLLSKPQGMTK